MEIFNTTAVNDVAIRQLGFDIKYSVLKWVSLHLFLRPCTKAVDRWDISEFHIRQGLSLECFSIVHEHLSIWILHNILQLFSIMPESMNM